MNEIKQQHLLLRIFAVLAPFMIIVGLAMLPNIYTSESILVPLEFLESRRTKNENSLTLKGTIRQELHRKQSLWLYAENAEITVNVNGQTFFCNERHDTPHIFRSPGNGWFSVNLSGITADQPMEITVRSYYGTHELAAEQLLGNLYIGDGSGLYHLLLSQIDFFGMLFLVVVIASLLLTTEGSIDFLLGVPDEGIRITLLGFYCFSGGLWCITDAIYPYLTLIISPAWVASMVDMAGLLLFPISLSLLMQYFVRGKYTHIVMNVIVILEILLAASCIALQLSGIADLVQLQIYMGIVAIPSIGVAMICVLIDLKQYHSRYLLLLFLTVLPVFISNLIDGINVLYTFMPRRTLMRYSFTVSVFMLLLQLVSYARKELTMQKYMKQVEMELTDSRISVMLSQIQPHFLYNTLTAISVLCDKDAKLAKKATAEFSEYLRGNLDSLTNTMPVPFERELRHVETYLKLEKLRFNEELNMVFNIRATAFMIPALTVQPLVENAVKYGVGKQLGGGTVTISTRECENFFEIVVSDDGVGFDPYEPQYDGRTHVGIDNVKNRLQKMMQATLSIESKAGFGTTAVIRIPKGE